MALYEASATQLLSQLESGEVTSVEVTKACLDRIRQHDGAVGAFLKVMDEKALAQAAEVDRKRKAGEELGLLAGVPVAVKDLLCTEGEVTTCASKMLKDFVPPYSSTVIKKLQAADAVIVGKTNMDEFAMGGSTENSALGKTRNPWNTDLVPGGSSGGAAACLAAQMVPLSIGTDTGGSIRQPASFCGVVGLKPTYGRVSRFGLIAFASSLDQIGPMARTAEDTALFLEAMSGHDPQDSTSANVPCPLFSKTVDQPLEGLRIGLVKEHFGEGLDGDVEKAVREAVSVYEKLGAKVVDISLPHNKYGIATYYIIAPSEASSNLARFDGAHYGHRCDEATMLEELQKEKDALVAAGDELGVKRMDTPLIRMYRQSRAEGFGPEVKRRIMLGTYTLSAGYYDAFYLKALKVRRLIREDYDKAFKTVDLIVGPTAPNPAFAAGSKTNDPLAMYLEDLYTVTANLAGIPAMSIPCGFTSGGLPVGLHMQAPALEEDRLLRAAYMFQKETDWHAKTPSL
ncbi:Asp-tRNA(Asn)/Glu-tRNA(Gln) amidotransferase GatCAB subunit A [Blastopirellula marina]|uniref:Glutamyl-tRNA(Gln) amidotransferase subunit A n=1 Tax=Blastopirellula marina TaxID=124 RepID=A0A2S8G3X7_9BACT|nr:MULTISPECIES: Asp-tRNA(Asn)/Glu-tRNA(Gln) amidotransferase subunit GatA [Pirellulaceae]PQO39155.1 Asp-tRNA(Asn)/Glu-tRNA(Gln) amidotransferase GatCAB subunit A [Blastopirellula marina]RCS55463.1 Asp-tRNA(Asn)/Glu-tRNA(Gln) amidotransferase subunit GatA [Bremerella cremea]